jgi:hypothetical protein
MENKDNNINYSSTMKTNLNLIKKRHTAHLIFDENDTIDSENK